MKLIAVVGMAGSGKSTAADILAEKDFKYIRFGQITIDELKHRGLEINEQNEKIVREEFRKSYGMAAYAKLNVLKIEELLEEGNVVADGMYSWEEYIELKGNFEEKMIVLAIQASPRTRYQRLENRRLDDNDKDARYRPTTQKESKERDYSEIEKLHKAGPIAMADYTILNESTIKHLNNQIEIFLEWVENDNK